MKGKTITLLFLNNSLRTRTSFDVGAFQMGGHAVVLTPSGGMWPLEFEKGAVMTGDAEEHVAEAAKVLSRYCDLIGIRAFPKFENWQEDRRDLILNSFAEQADVPVINMETITHPCQEMALSMALQEQLGELDGKKFVLTWSYHPKPLNTAVANSALMIAAKFGMDVTLLCPSEDYLLDKRYMDIAANDAAANGRTLTVTHDIESAYLAADVIYAKSWGAPSLLRAMGRRETNPRQLSPLHCGRSENGTGRRRTGQPLSADETQRDHERRGFRRTRLLRLRRG